jgi:ribosomal-protein-alanine N-acetyltransferase
VVVGELTIREMTAADHPVIGVVGFAAWSSSDALSGVDLSAEVRERTRRAYELFPSEANGDVWVAELDGEVVGWLARNSATNYISDLWVLPQQQGRGVGMKLVLFAIDRIRADGHRTATIHAHARNTGAIRLYERCGFSIVWRGIEHSTSMEMDLKKVHLELPLT